MTKQNGIENEPENQNEQIVNKQVEFLRGLAHIVRDESLSELSLEQDGVRVILKSAAPGTPLVMALPAAVGGASSGATADAGLVPVVSPMVGVFYRAPSPNDPSFVEIGDHVNAGQVIGVVEAMKVFNEIVSEVEGTVAEIPAQNAELVETGTPLILVKKS